MYSAQRSSHFDENLIENSHLIASGSKADGRDSRGLRTEGHTSLGSFFRLADGASNFYHSAGNAVSGAVDTIAGAASSAYHGTVNLANTASGYVQRAGQGITSGLHAAEDWVDRGSHALAGRAANVPVLGSAAQAVADQVTMGTQIAGGVLGEAKTMVGGIANAALHPIDTAAGVEAMVEHTPGPLGTMARGTHDLIDVAQGRQTVDGMIHRAVNPRATAEEDAQFWGRMGSAVVDPYRQSVKEGRYGEAVGRGVFDIGSMLIGAGEVGEAARGVGVAGDVARAGDVADAARVASTAGETTRALGATTDATRAIDATADVTRAAESTADALSPRVGQRPPNLDIDARINERAAAANESLRPASSAKQQELLREDLRQNQKYGAERTLPDGRIRYYGDVDPARNAGEMAGRRVTREWNPETGQQRTWQETVDHQGRIRQARPEESRTGGKKVHYKFGQDGKYQGKW